MYYELQQTLSVQRQPFVLDRNIYVGHSLYMNIMCNVSKWTSDT